MKVTGTQWTIEGASLPGAPPIHAQQLRFDGPGEAGTEEAESPAHGVVAPTQSAHSDHERAPRIAPASKGTAVGYVRVSTEDQTRGYSLEAQRAEIERYCDQNGYQLERFYSDEGISAHTDRISKRPQLTLLLAHARQQRFDVVLVHTLDRWARNMRVQTEALQILGDARVGFASVTESIDYTTPEGRLMLTMIGGFAEFFSAQLGRHVKKGVRQRAEHGLPNGSVPFGYLKDEETGIPCLVPHEAEAVETVFAKRAAGKANGAIARWLNAEGFRTRRGSLFTDASIRDMLGCRFYLGVVTLNGQEYPGQHEGIIALDLFERVQTRTVKRGPGRRTAGGPRGLLAGIVRCGHCGKRLQADRNRSGNPLYRERHASECQTNRRSCVASGIDAQIGDVFGFLILPQDWKQKIARQSVKTEGPSVSDLEGRRFRLGRSYRDGTITEDEYQRELEELDAQLRMAQLSTPVELDEVAELLENLTELWSEATADERRRLLQTLVEAVYVDIGSRRIVAIAPVPAFRALLESAIERTADPSAVLISPDDVETLESMELVETGENRTPRPASVRHGSATGVVGEKISPACLHRRGVGRPAPVILAARPVARLRGCSPAFRRRLPVCRAEPGGDVTAWLGGEGEFSFASYGLPPV